jgi:hypothetical protein
MDKLAPYREQLTELERRRNQSFALFFGAFAIALLDGFFHFLPKTDVLVVVFLAILVAADFRLRWFPCPRCFKPFMRGTFYVHPWTGKCLHCGLPALDSL